MVDVTVIVPAYPFDGVAGIQASEATLFGWSEVLDTAVVGVFPAYITDYTVTVTSAVNPIRVRWETSAGHYTAWFNPSSVVVTPTASQTERITQAIIQKSTRFLMLAGAPLGSWGEMSEFGMASVRPDYETSELLYGLRFKNWDVDLTSLVTTADVIRQGLQSDPADFPAAKLPDVQRAIDGAASWVAEHLLHGVGVA